MSTITRTQAEVLAYAFRFFNDRLFGGTLPDCMVVLHRKHGARGYHRSDAYVARSEDADKPFVNEIALNPEAFEERTDRQIFSTLVHEMCHLWEHAYGKDYNKSSHTKEWAHKMEAIGLIPSSTGEPGGKQTGRNVSHYIQVNGPFDAACTELLRYVHFQYESQPPIKRAPKQTIKRVKMACPFCAEVEVRATPGTKVRCGKCDELLEEVA